MESLSEIAGARGGVALVYSVQLLLMQLGRGEVREVEFAALNLRRLDPLLVKTFDVEREVYLFKFKSTLPSF